MKKLLVMTINTVFIIPFVALALLELVLSVVQAILKKSLDKTLVIRNKLYVWAYLEVDSKTFDKTYKFPPEALLRK